MKTFFSLLLTRRFGAMFACMALGAFNDNYYKNAVIILITYVLAEQLQLNPAVLISIAAACFILPFFIFSGIAGMLADRYAKHQVMRVLKVTEFGLCVLIGVALLYQHVWSLMALLFLLGTQAAFFGPVKYAILPELLKREELLAGNGLIEAGTFLAILLGTLLGGLLVLHPQGVEIVAASMLLLALAGMVAAWKIPVTEAARPHLRIRYNIFATTWEMLLHAIKEPAIFYAILGISWFWAIGATYLTQLPIFSKEVVGGNNEVVTWFMALFSIGIAVGSLSCQKLLHGKPDMKVAPLALAGICLFGFDLCWAGQGIVHGEDFIGLHRFLAEGWAAMRLSVDLFLLAVCGGLFIVPLYTQLQLKSDPGQRARAIASNNVMNALFIALAAVLATLLYAVQWNVLEVLGLFAAANIPVILYLYRRSHLRNSL